jgi:hypothetical protein
MMRGGGLAPESSAEMLAADSYGDDFADVGTAANTSNIG